MPERFATHSDAENERNSSDEEDELGPVNGKWPFGGVGRSFDVPVPSGATCMKINKVLAQAEANAGEYTFGGVAEALPALPGLVVEDVGQISVPLTESCAKKLIDKCEKSCYGHNFDTKMDENVRKSWQVEPERVQNSVPMQCSLYKMLVYGEGGHFVKHQDTEKEDGMVATLVIQLPSTHEGGDLVIYRGGEPKYRHDFGKKDGSAAFLPHYAVHYADADHSLEEVTKGYRLALVYSLCLPLSMRHLKRDHEQLLSEELADALSTIGPEAESFALLLVHEYTEKSIGDLGSGALKGIDRARFVALEESNAIEYFGQDGLEMCAWEETSRKHSITWFSTSGQCFGVKKKPTIKINFLNPGHETFYALWRPHGSSEEHGYMGNHGPSKNTMYYRYAVVAWPAAQDVRNALQFINTEAAVNALKTQKPIDAGALGEIMSKIQAKLEKKKYRPKPISTEFCQAICEVLVTAGDVAVVSKFFRKSFNKLCARLQDCKTVIPVLVSMLRSLNWNDVGAAVLESLGQMHRPTSVAISVFVANGLDDGEAKTALMQFAMEKAVQLSNGLASCSARCAEILWKWAFCLDDTDALNTFADKMMKLQPTSVDVATQALVQCSQEMAAKGDRPAALKAIADNWVSWLKAQIQDLEKPFSWEMPDAKFPGNAQQGEASYMMAASEEDGTAFVTITKTKAWFSARQKKLSQYMTELNVLTTHFGQADEADEMRDI
ncbi:hypothetical protein PHYSODRAFT_328539 [Phytophthora sojae]|uniref:Fe2OG dioxygenase domain-containing protein n=1 Tax=Phytophthora sojae (strain P6497) TaxID=1094619 RepID=G4Z887_PHYSP|nr:hypothetical protein PHYSODRAFT_328539 [Phytophthora sojae]EGZ20439.1 hypothetical protein PHYSODRAFT_328539 [Phytophthora sojae]|eukprot:XP_009523156.1 hypothetical protein PHYSODRAFT_328539 [Phytophthora sojae]